MNKSYLFLLISLFLVLGCGEKNLSPDPEEEPQEEQPRETPDPVVISEPFMVHSEIIDQFLSSVTYDERDYSYTRIFDSPWGEYGAPGELDRPNALNVTWEAFEKEGPLTLTLE